VPTLCVGDPDTASLTLDAFVVDSTAAYAAKAAKKAGSLVQSAAKGSGVFAFSADVKRVSQPAGSVHVPLAPFAWHKGMPFPAARWHDLSGGGRVRLQLVVIQAPPA
jgi:hypothetical protein